MTAAWITDPKLKEMKKAVILSKCLSQAMTMTERGIQLKWPGIEIGFLARVLCKLGLKTESQKLHFLIHLFQHSGAHGKRPHSSETIPAFETTQVFYNHFSKTFLFMELHKGTPDQGPPSFTTTMFRWS